VRPDPATRVRRYYEKNTRLFLSLGISGRTLSMHRAVWADGARTLAEAVCWVNGLVAREAEGLARQAGADTDRPLRVLDIGCGVGGTLFSVAAKLDGRFDGVGVTVSPLQAQMARAHALRTGRDRSCRFIDGDFATLPGDGSFDLAFAIESFVHFAAPDSFFAAAARALPAGGRLLVVDDFLSRRERSASERAFVTAFREGWILPSLCTVEETAGAARRHGLRVVEDRNLDPFLRQTGLGPRAGRLLVGLMRGLPVPWAYWKSTTGSIALSLCQRAGLTTYRCLVFEKAEGPPSGDG
jgi:tocopherol O-methyltransferase